MPGWIDNLNGPMGLIVGCGVGFIRVLLGSRSTVPDWLEVDIGINAMITGAWYQALNVPEKKSEW